MLNIEEFKKIIEQNHNKNEQYTFQELMELSYQIYINEMNDKNTEIDKKNLIIKEKDEEIEQLKNATINATSRKKATVKKGVKLTEKQIEFIRDLSENYRLSREHVLRFFNEQYPKRKELLTMAQLRKIMEDNNIIKPKKATSDSNATTENCDSSDLKESNQFS